jgi:hypothetical protein
MQSKISLATGWSIGGSMRVGPVFALLVLIATQGCSSAPPSISTFYSQPQSDDGFQLCCFVQIPQASMMPNASERMKEYFRKNNAQIGK